MTLLNRPLGVRPDNSFDVLRIIAASLVIIGHGWPLHGSSAAPLYANITIHHLGVYIFFTISGYLLTLSRNRDHRLVTFLSRRVLRIFPALIATVFLTVFVIGPALSTLAASAYFRHGDTWQYLSGALLMPTYHLPGVFEHNPLTAVNGSLWSLGPEFVCYLMLAFTGFLPRRFRISFRATLLIALLATLLFANPGHHLTITLTAFAFFLCGSLLADVPRPAFFKPWIAVVALLAVLPIYSDVGRFLAFASVSYAVVTLGNLSSRVASAIRQPGDPSYGMYLWAFLIQQVFVPLALPPAISVALTWVCAALAGYASWHLIEKHALKAGYLITAKLSPHHHR